MYVDNESTDVNNPTDDITYNVSTKMHNRPMDVIELSLTKEFKFCSCCDNSVSILIRKPLNEQIEGTNSLGVRNLLQNKDIANMNDSGKYMVEWCIDFFLFQKYNNDNNINYPKQNVHTIHKNKEITIWRFICDFFNIQPNSGYDYYVLTWLERNNISEHGCAIRCGWILHNRTVYSNRTLNQERAKILDEWAKNLQDEFL